MRHFPASHQQRRHETTRTEMVKVLQVSSAGGGEDDLL